MKICARSVSAVLAIIALPSVAQADESLWIYAKGAETLPKGRTEVKASVISRRGKADSDYVFNDIRLEAERGITNRLTGYI